MRRRYSIARRDAVFSLGGGLRLSFSSKSLASNTSLASQQTLLKVFHNGRSWSNPVESKLCGARMAGTT
jgi:hypothetical protein